MKKTTNKGSLTDLIDIVFTVNGEMIEKNGEDSYAFSISNKRGITAVFDGCGGLGSRKYAELGNKSGAYVASRGAAKALLQWFDGFNVKKPSESADFEQFSIRNLHNIITEELKSYEKTTSVSTIKGSMTKNFPTTASVIFFEKEKEKMTASYIWTGDSRGFILDSKGLCQVTSDDIEETGDALLNISNDSKLTNVISSDGKYTLNCRNVKLGREGIMITATDGCFGYFSTPMEFEYILLLSLMKADSALQWKKNLSDYIKKYTADDYTMGVVAFGYKSFKKLKKALNERFRYIESKYIKNLKDSDSEKINSLWSEYKKNYYREV